MGKKNMFFLIAIVTCLSIIPSLSCTGENADGKAKEGTPGAPQEMEPQKMDNHSPVVSPVTSLHPAFSISESNLQQMIADMPENIKTNIMSDPNGFLSMTEKVLNLPEELFFLVDKNHPLPSTYIPADLVPLENYNFVLNKEGMQLREICIPNLLEMVFDAQKEGLTLLISSTYRSYEYQASVFQYHVNTIGEEQAKRESAEPGKSQHQLGTTVDFGSITPEFGDTPEGKWLFENGWKYGFSLSYPDGYEHLTGYIHEIWHYRWISKTGTAYEKTYFDGMQHYMLTFLYENRDSLEEMRIKS